MAQPYCELATLWHSSSEKATKLWNQQQNKDVRHGYSRSYVGKVLRSRRRACQKWFAHISETRAEVLSWPSAALMFDDDDVSMCETPDAVQPSSAVWITSRYDRCPSSSSSHCYPHAHGRNTRTIYTEPVHLTSVTLSFSRFLVYSLYCSLAISFLSHSRFHTITAYLVARFCFKAPLYTADGHDTPPRGWYKLLRAYTQTALRLQAHITSNHEILQILMVISIQARMGTTA